MELTQLIQFKMIAECETMTQASEKLHVSQPALSATLKKLEEELGIKLFDRKRNHISLNPAGEIVLRHVNDMVNQIDQMKRELYLYERKDRTFSIAFCDPGPMWYCIPSFSIAYPELEVQSGLFEDIDDIREVLMNEVYDVIISTEPINTKEVISVPFIKEQLLLSVTQSSPLAKKKELSLRKEPQPTITVYYVGGAYFQHQQPFWEEMKDQIELNLCNDYFVFSQMMKNTNQLAISTRIASHYRDDGNDRVLIPITDTELSISYYVCYLKKNRKKAEKFLTWISEFCEE